MIAALEAGAAFVVLALIPSEGGISILRLGLFVLLFLFFAFWFFFALRPPQSLDRFANPGWIWAAAIQAGTVGLALFLLRYLDPGHWLPVYARLAPVLWYLLVLSIQAAFFLLWLRHGAHPGQLRGRIAGVRSALFIFCFLLFVFCFIAFTRLGLTPDPAYWGEPGVAIQGWQFILALFLGLFAFCFLLSRPRLCHIDLALPILLWLMAAVLWLSVPVDVLRNGFYVSINPPDQQPYPYSDAGYYDSMAHSLLIGHPYQGQIPTRPLYITLLAGLHLLLGENYPAILAAQTLLLAFIPVVFYLLGAKLHSRSAGVTVALLAIFREYTSLWISSDTRVSNTKMLLVDLPTLLLLSLACLFALRWLERRDNRSAFLAGGTFGIFLLLRTQSLLVLPFVLLLVLLAYGWKDRRWLAAGLVFALGLAVTVAPWLTHNYLKIGQFAFDAPFEYKVIASQYAYAGNLDLQNYDLQGKSLPRILIDFTLQDPGFVFGFIANHFLAGEADALLALPLIEPYNGISAPVNLYWTSWTGSLPWYNVLLLIFYLAVIAVGLAACWKRWRWAGLLPLAFNIGYALATAVGRFSGWRYDLPADWVPYFYFAIGFVECLGLAAAWLGAGNGPEEFNATSPGRNALFPPSFQSLRPFIFPALLFLFFGALPWLAEFSAGPRYPEVSAAALQAQMDPSAGSAVEAFLAQPDAVITEGRLLYPRFFTRDNGMASTNAWPAYAIRDYPRTGFLLLNQTRRDVLFPSREIQPFVHAADAIVVGCQRDGYIEARLVVFPESGKLYRSERGLDSCALP